MQTNPSILVSPFHQKAWRQHSQNVARRALMTVATVALAVLSGCAGKPQVAEIPRMVWPEPPEVTRIEYLRAITSDEDLNKETTSSQTVLKFLEGEKPPENRIVDPMGLGISEDGDRLYVSDHAQGAVFVYDFAKKTSFKIGKDTPLASPMGLALDAQENIYVVEQAKQGVSVFDRTGKVLRFITDASITRPTGVAIDKDRGKLYVVDTARGDVFDNTVKIFDLQGKMLGKIGQGKGNIGGAFLFPTFIAVGANGHVFVSDTLNSRVQEFDTKGEIVQVFGKRGNGFGMFDKPKGVGLDSFGNVYIVDSGWSNVQIFNPHGRILLFFGARGAFPGLMQNPSVLAIDKKNRIYVGDSLNHRVNVYQLVNTTAEDAIEKEESGKEAGKK